MSNNRRYWLLLLGIAIIAIPILLAYYLLHVLTVLLLFMFIFPGFLLKKKEDIKYFLFGLVIGGAVSILFFLYVVLHLGL